MHLFMVLVALPAVLAFGHDLYLLYTDHGFGGIPDTTLDKEKDLRLEIAFYEKQIYEEKLKGEKADEEAIKNFESTLFDMKRDLEKLVEELEANYPKYISRFLSSLF